MKKKGFSKSGYSRSSYGKKSVQERFKVKDVNEEGGPDFISAWVNNNLNKTQMSNAEGIKNLMQGPKLGYNVRKRRTSEPREEDE
jgi:hypothetical protein